jgi:hypothetical protein
MGKAVAKYIAASRRPAAAPVRGRRAYRAVTNGRPRRTHADREHSAAIRTWAREHGHAVSDKGRIRQEIETAYEQYIRSSGGTTDVT